MCESLSKGTVKISVEINRKSLPWRAMSPRDKSRNKEKVITQNERERCSHAEF